ncbi:MAG: hypothetical protein PUC00_03290 [Clostridiales bacterium]|nr:hypothetical protein [Clostridiales bacterium]
MRQLKRMLTLLLLCALLLSAVPALAEDVCIVADATAATHVTTARPYLQVKCPLPEETDVTLSVCDQWGYLIYQRDYGVCSGTFRSSDIHLPLEGESCDYTVTLTTDGGTHAFTVTREQPMLTDPAVYAGGLPLSELNGGSGQKYAVVLDLDALNQETATFPLRSGDLQLGEVYFSVLDGMLTVSANVQVEGKIEKANVYIATDAITATTLGTSHFTGIKTRLDRQINLGSAPYAAVMVQLTLTYDPARAQPYQLGAYEMRLLEEVLENWRLMQLTTANEAVG